ncbi:hypothetical protein [Granulicella sp. S190]|uniref:hypothetical protein n=1 Tax=Granulicella sp. S190 TaxID=1747226 RepID=UPI00131CA336|nr:hypothetical protein [Granulicella sp. S190]
MAISTVIPHRMRVSFYPIERIERGAHRGGADDEDFDPAALPFALGNEIIIEDISALIPEDEFDIYKPGIGSYAYAHLKSFKYALVHRFPEYEINEDTQVITPESVLVERSKAIIHETAACLRLIRPTSQYLHLFEGRIGEDGRFTQIGMDTPLTHVLDPINQRNFGFRTKDAVALRRLAPLLRAAMRGEFWKFRMALIMHEYGCFQNQEWKVKFFLWTTGLESLFTTVDNQGSLVSSERIKFFLGADTLIYPRGELASIYPDPKLTVTDVIGEIYCLRNHIAHGDRVPNYYFQNPGRPESLYGSVQIPKYEMLLEAISYIIRASLLKILDDGLISHFRDNVTADAYFGSHGLTKLDLKKSKKKMPRCPS